jgi:hypothetical protein
VAVTFIYFVSASLFESFSGDRLLALRAVPPTLRDAATFRNITGAYLYASAIAGLPLFVAAVVEAMQRWPTFGRVVAAIFFFLPLHKKPIRSIAFVVGSFYGMFSLIARLTMGLQGQAV